MRDVAERPDLETLFRDQAPRLWRSIYGFAGGRRQIAEDAVAEAFARALEHADSIRDPLPWIYRTAFRIATRELKREKRALGLRAEAPPEPDAAGLHDLLRALAALPFNQRAAVILHHGEGLSAAEVSRLLGMSPATVRVHAFRGRKRLREILGSEEDDDD